MKDKCSMVSNSTGDKVDFCKPINGANDHVHPEKVLITTTDEIDRKISVNWNGESVDLNGLISKEKYSRDSGFISSSLSEFGVSSLSNGSAGPTTATTDAVAKEFAKYEHILSATETRVIDVFIFIYLSFFVLCKSCD